MRCRPRHQACNPNFYAMKRFIIFLAVCASVLGALANARPIDRIIVHCSATPRGRDVRPADIRMWHKAQGWKDIGYHFVVTLDGKVHPGRPLQMQGAHCKGYNATSIGLCYIGGCDSCMRPADTRTPQQRRALARLVDSLLTAYPHATVHAHYEYAPKACPSFCIDSLWMP